ncbi:hypothetical protein B0T18DRAFT_424555 [Schizothecium vesticola]|uniref:Mid2 domain-containing protein n=1 Tax=Schizothecium vesticola TaxID=314040 RepID=A0AA40KCF8_9PEZI|nr:hypothetical protein B0T18DRAFT_424555 [Schizothecium vesticola]
MINLLVHDTAAPKQFRIVGRGLPAKQNDQTTILGTTVTDVGDDPVEGDSAAQRRDANQKRQPQSEGTNPTLGDPRSIIKLEVTSTTDGGSVTIADLSKVIQRAQPLYFEAIWPSTRGKSYSPAFAVLNDTDTDGLDATAKFPKIFRNEPFLPEDPQSTDLNSGTGTGTSSGPTLSVTAMPPSSTANGSSGSISGSSGLPTGALAGIGAACGVLGLLLIAFAIWYFLHKKKRRQQHGAIAPYDETGISRTRTDELMAAEKEANLSSSAAAASGSPYSDADATRAVAHRSSMSGGGGAAAPLIAPVAVVGAAAAVSPADGPPSYTPYTDRPASGAGSGTGTTAEEPAVVSTQYAHLVEEGMTAEQIRRLEEEERALDAAIEQAVRRPTG